MKKSTYLLTMILVLCMFTACQSVPEEVSYDATEAEILQMAQTAIDNSNTLAARYYFETLIARYGTNHASLVVAEFELAHLDVKEKNYDAAKPVLERIISYYDDPILAQALPPEYKKLAEIDLAKIVEE